MYIIMDASIIIYIENGHAKYKANGEDKNKTV
jgi:hypothetical protein